MNHPILSRFLSLALSLILLLARALSLWWCCIRFLTQKKRRNLLRFLWCVCVLRLIVILEQRHLNNYNKIVDNNLFMYVILYNKLVAQRISATFTATSSGTISSSTATTSSSSSSSSSSSGREREKGGEGENEL